MDLGNSKLVSIIVPVYNAPDYVEICLFALINNTKPSDIKTRQKLIKEMFAEVGENCFIEIPFYAKQKRYVLKNCGFIGAEDIEEYISKGGYASAKKACLEMTPEQICKEMLDSGLRGRGGAGFPTAVKLSPKEPEKIEYVIANCSECEPYLTSDYRRMIEEPELIIGGLKIAVSLFPNARGILAVEDNKPEAIKKLRELTKDEPKIEVKQLQTKYPQGAERMLIYACTGRSINSSMLPADAGCIVDNTDTLCAIYRAVTEGRPLMERIVTITGDAIKDPCNYKVRIGTSYQELLDDAGGFYKTPQKIISGGPMMGFAVWDTEVPTTKTASALTCLTEDAVSAMEPTACINCARCVEACPEQLIPKNLADAVEHGQTERFLKEYGMECCECGCCSFICPAHRHLTQLIKGMRKIQLANRKKK